jgi:hypothetical protein
MTTRTRTAKSQRKTIENTPELREALVHAAIILGCERTTPPESNGDAEDRKVALKLAEFARQLGATF